MAGHSHSANIARRKGAVDAKRGKVFSKLARAIISAARQGGGDPDANLKLRYAIDKAKAANVPKDTIERAVQRGSGSKDSDAFEEVIYEGYAPGGVALMVASLTDNRHRTSPDIKHIFDRSGGNLGSPGSVAFMFTLKSVIAVEAGGRGEDALTELALDVGAEDVEIDGGTAILTGAAQDFPAIKSALEKQGCKLASAELAYVPGTRVPVTDKEEARKLLRLIDTLEDLDDVQSVYANYEMPVEWLEELGP
jgi:YebC/PmpR family DNA-binding regulatory protein